MKATKVTGCDIGVVGLGVMGRNLALNMSDKGFVVAGYDIDPRKVEALAGEGRASRLVQRRLSMNSWIVCGDPGLS